MFKLRVIQAEEGDCLVLLYGSAAAPRFALVDGGPSQIWEQHLSGELAAIAAAGGSLDLVVLSHVDTDHAIGLLDFLAEARADRQAGGQGILPIGELWHNQFDATLDTNGTIEPRLRNIVQTLGASGVAMRLASAELATVEHGSKLTTAARLLGLPIIPAFAGNLILAPGPGPLAFDNLTLQVVGPTQTNLDALQGAWETWLAAQEKRLGRGDVQLAAFADKSIPNLSSIQLLAEADGKTMLLTGDGRGDHLLSALEDGGHLTDGRFHVDLLKLPHHGSDRNVTRGFFEKVTADIYVISANGRHGNPDLATLEWIVEAAADEGRQIQLFLTNETADVRRFVQSFPPAQFGYVLNTMPAGQSSMDVELAP
jgi:beta-lactamase superfamily II metal-dependent hydrolase